MKLENADAVKKWLRGLPLLKKELELKIDFYTALMRDFKRLGKEGDQSVEYYLAQIRDLQAQIRGLAGEVDRLMDGLFPDERMILTARYVRRLSWDAMEFHVHFCRRHAIRIHNRAVQKLVGARVGGFAYEKEG